MHLGQREEYYDATSYSARDDHVGLSGAYLILQIRIISENVNGISKVIQLIIVAQ